jgi:hypothetical protein
MNRRALLWLFAVCLAIAAMMSCAAQSASQSFPLASAVSIPFELANWHIMLAVTVNDSRPLAFVLDTGDKYAILDRDRAKELGLQLGADVKVRGTSSQSATGAFLRDVAFHISGLPAFSGPVTLAIPLKNLAPRFGRDFDGIVGADFIQAFVVELDYQARTITLHDSRTFAYAGPGESIPITLNPAGHPVLDGEVTPIGSDPITGKFIVDIGASGTVTLDSPFVAEHHLPGRNLTTIKGMGVGGVGGDAAGRIGRLAALKIGTLTVRSPTAFFSEDTAGANAGTGTAGSIGARVLSRFKLFLDYSHGRIIFEPNATFADAFDRASSGLLIEAEGNDYKTFRVKEVLQNSPGSEAGLRPADVIIAIDARSASELTLSELLELFERPVLYKMVVQRKEHTLIVTLTPRRLV